MTEEEVEAAARSDPDAQPLTEAQLKRMRRVPFAKHVRWKVGLSQAEFARRFQIPIGTLRDWEQWRSEPDQAALAYLKVIAADARFVERALAAAEVRSTPGTPGEDPTLEMAPAGTRVCAPLGATCVLCFRGVDATSGGCDGRAGRR